ILPSRPTKRALHGKLPESCRQRPCARRESHLTAEKNGLVHASVRKPCDEQIQSHAAAIPVLEIKGSTKLQSTDQNQPLAPSVPETPAPAPPTTHSLRNEIRVWTRDLLIAIGLALVIIVFLYQPVKVEGTSMAPLLSDQERIFINKFVYRFEPIHRR